MNRADLIQEYIDDLNEIANLCENEPERNPNTAAEHFGEIHCICLERIKELADLRIRELPEVMK